MAASGHKPNGVHDGYVNFSDAQLIEAFSKAGLMAPPKPKSAARAKAMLAFELGLNPKNSGAPY